MDYKTVVRGKITYYITDSSVVVSVGGHQYVSYNVYNSPNKSGLSEFKKRILASKQNQFDNVVEQMDLAQKCKIIGSGISKPIWIEDDTV